MGQGKKRGEEHRATTVNRRAWHEYHVEETFEVGIALSGTEVKSLRIGRASIQESFAHAQNGELWIHNMHIAPYEQGNRANVDPLRKRKLLMHRREIDWLTGKTEQKGMTLIPLKVYFKRGKAKMELGLCRGKQMYDKREAIAERDRQRDIERALHGKE